jgi:hypothetical protein
MSLKLTPEKGLIFRITHRDNLLWILEHGLHCTHSPMQDPKFVSIGNPELIGMRGDHPIPGGGTLGDYVPFYFTPWSPMLFNIRTGWGGIRKRERSEIVFLVSSLPKLQERGVRFVFSDRHAYLQAARFGTTLAELPEFVPWGLLQARDFKKDPENPFKSESYQAEALVHQHVPVEALLGIVCHDELAVAPLRGTVAGLQPHLTLHVRPSWYF